jgi:L-aspartate oxidase
VNRYLINFDTRSLERQETDVLVIGSGAAGLRAAIAAAEFAKVLIITKAPVAECNTHYAQGGIACPFSESDTTAEHVADTLRVGDGLSNRAVARRMVGRAPEAMRELLEWGMRFDRSGGRIELALEGGHSRPRVLHAGGDATGAELLRTLVARAKDNPNIQIRENCFTLDLLTGGGRCLGAIVWCAGCDSPVAILARETILATGGAGQIFRETTNPDVATGDGIAMALRAGVVLEDLEMVQFHPTTLYIPGAVRSLISEAVRGAGAFLRDNHGTRFMPDYHRAAELAPRDVVSRAIVRQMQITRDTSAYLDLTHLSAGVIRARFPKLAKLCEEFGIDITRDTIPVRPSAHYFIGGVRTDMCGRTSLTGLRACGEVACTEFHGANRLASNSLIEALVMGTISGAESGKAAEQACSSSRAVRDRSNRSVFPQVDVQDVRNSLKSLMWRSAGVEREGAEMTEALQHVGHWSSYILDRQFDSPSGWELQNMLIVAAGVLRCALSRTESRGVHYRTDFPSTNDRKWRKHTFLKDR